MLCINTVARFCIILSRDRLLLFFCRLSQLQTLSLDNNFLQELPLEICAVSSLEELHVANNELTSLPFAIGCLTKLSHLYVQKNKLKELPEVKQFMCLSKPFWQIF